jgi:hypothetical protein
MDQIPLFKPQILKPLVAETPYRFQLLVIPIFSKIIHHHESVLSGGIKAGFALHRLESIPQEKLLGCEVFLGRVEKKPLLPQFFRFFLR